MIKVKIVWILHDEELIKIDKNFEYSLMMSENTLFCL